MDSRTVVENQAVSAGETVPCVVGKKRGILVDNKDREDSREICQKRPCSQLSQVLARTDALVQELDVLLKTRDTVYEFDPDDSVNIELISQARKYHYSDGKIPEQFYGLIARLIQDRNDSLTELSLKIHQILVGQRSNCSLDQFAVREAILTMAKRKCYDGRGTKFGNDEMDSLERIFWEVDSKYLNFLPVDQIAPIKSSRKIRDLTSKKIWNIRRCQSLCSKGDSCEVGKILETLDKITELSHQIQSQRLREADRKMKEEQKLKRQQLLEHQKIERDAREQEKENERRLKEAERRAREEELTRRREEKRQQEEMALKAQQSLMTNFFGAPRPISPVAKPKGESTLFQPWQEPEYATIARPHRCSLRPISLDSLNSQTVDLRDVLRGVKHRAKRWIRKRGSGRVFKLLQFHTEYRPAYFGTFSKRSRRVCGRNPFAKDDTIDYTYDSDDEWEDESEGESLSSAEDDEDEEMMDQPGIPVRRDGLVEDGWLMPENEDHFTSVDISAGDKFLPESIGPLFCSKDEISGLLEPHQADLFLRFEVLELSESLASPKPVMSSSSDVALNLYPQESPSKSSGSRITLLSLFQKSPGVCSSV